MKSITGPDSAVLTGLASIHLVNLSTMNSKYFFLWVPPLRGPTMSSPQTAKGHVMGIVWRAVGGIWLWFAKSGNQCIVGLSPERLPGPSANKSLYGRPCLQGPKLQRDDRRVRHEFQPEGS